MAKVQTYKNFDFTKIEFSSPREAKNGSKTVNFIYPNQEEWFFQSPKSKVPFNPYDTNFCITVNNDLESKLKELQDIIVAEGVKNSMSWFDANKTEAEVRDILVPLMAASKGDFPPFLRINFTNGCEIYNADGEMVDKDAIVQRCQVRVIIRFVKLYIKEKDGKLVMRCNIDLTQARLSNDDAKPSSYAFVESDEE